nr:hypothetical protein CFP56_56713 [Quercus suber]
MNICRLLKCETISSLCKLAKNCQFSRNFVFFACFVTETLTGFCSLSCVYIVAMVNFAPYPPGYLDHVEGISFLRAWMQE